MHYIKKKSVLIISVIISFICIVIASLLISLKIGDISFIPFLAKNSITLDIKCTRVEVGLTEKKSIEIVGFNERITAENIQVKNIRSVNILNAGLSFHDSLSLMDFKLKNAVAEIESIEMNKSKFISVEATNTNSNIIIKEGNIFIKIIFYEAEILEPWSKTVSASSDSIPFFAYLESRGYGDMEISMTCNDPTTIMQGVKINSISFSDNYILGNDLISFASTIESGELRFNDLNRNVELYNQDWVRVTELEGRFINVKIEDDLLSLKIVGEAGSIFLGSESAAKNISPTLLEYFNKNQPLSMFWGAIVFCWAIVTSVIQYLKKP